VSLTRRADRRRLSESGPFCTDSLCHARQFFRVEASMPALKNDKFKDYTRYADHCLNMMASTTDHGSRRIQHEMAAEWLRLAEAIRPSVKSWQIDPLKSR